MLYGEDAEIKALETQSKILAAMYDNEKINPKIMEKAQRKEVAKTA